MKKVTNISLAGIAFSIEEDAYSALQAYLAAIEAHFAPQGDGEEILADIERGIGEKLTSQLKMPGAVVSLSMVEQVMEEMGRVEDIIGADDESAGGASTAQANEKSAAPRKFFRDTDNAILGGVAAGIGNYFAIDPTIVRLAFVIAAFLNGIGILAYLILWLIVPAAKTTSEKYQMRGEQVTLSHIAKQIQENVEVHIEDGRIKGLGAHIRTVLNSVFTFLGLIVRLVFKVIRVILGVLLTLGGTLEIAAATALVTLLVFVVNPEISDPITAALMAHITSSTVGIVFIVSAYIAALVVPITAIMAGVSLLTARNRFTVRSVLVLGITWVVAFSIALSTFLTMLPVLSSTVEAAERSYQNSERTWHTAELSEAPESILVRGQVSVHVVEDDEVSLRILASEDTYREVYVQQNGSDLAIDRDTHFRICFYCNVYGPYVVEIHAPNVEDLRVRGNGDVLIEGATGEALDLNISGAFDFVAENIDVVSLSLRASGANDISLAGNAANASLTLYGASDTYTPELAVGNMEVDASGAHTVYVAPSARLTGELTGGNSLYYNDNENLAIDVEQYPKEANDVEVLTESIATTSTAAQVSLKEDVRKTFEESE